MSATPLPRTPTALRARTTAYQEWSTAAAAAAADAAAADAAADAAGAAPAAAVALP